jgi:hypothetical protein
MERNLLIELLALQKIDIQMKEKEKQKMIVITGTELLGELTFKINDE